METAIPKGKNLQLILERVGQDNPHVKPLMIRTALGLLEFSTAHVSVMEFHFARYGLSQGRFTMLMPLYHLSDKVWTPTILADFGGITQGTVTGLLDVLEKGGWIQRQQHPSDGRATEVVLTKNGRRRMKKILKDHFRRGRKAVSGLTSKEQETLLKLLAKATEAFATLREDDE